MCRLSLCLRLVPVEGLNCHPAPRVRSRGRQAPQLLRPLHTTFCLCSFADTANSERPSCPLCKVPFYYLLDSGPRRTSPFREPLQRYSNHGPWWSPFRTSGGCLSSPELDCELFRSRTPLWPESVRFRGAFAKCDSDSGDRAENHCPMVRPTLAIGSRGDAGDGTPEHGVPPSQAYCQSSCEIL